MGVCGRRARGAYCYARCRQWEARMRYLLTNVHTYPVIATEGSFEDAPKGAISHHAEGNECVYIYGLRRSEPCPHLADRQLARRP